MITQKFVSRHSLGSSRVDREADIIKGVSLIAIGDARGHDKAVDKQTLHSVINCAKGYGEGLRVRFNPNTFTHGAGSLAGFIPSDSLRVKGDKAVGDLHLYKAFPAEAKEYLYEIMERTPGNIGLSIEFTGDDEEIKGQKFARCEEIFAATIVDLPAANPTGLFSSNEPYGDVEYADPGYQADKKKRYPIDDEEHIRAAWSYINQGENAGEYASDHLTKIKNKIKTAARKHGIEINEDMSMNDEQVTKLTTSLLDAVKQGFDGLKQQFAALVPDKNDKNDKDKPTDTEMLAAGCMPTDTDEQKKAKLEAYRAGNKPVSSMSAKDIGEIVAKSTMQFFRQTGGKPAKATVENEGGEQNEFEAIIENQMKLGARSLGHAINMARHLNGKAYNEWMQKKHPNTQSMEVKK